MVMAFCTHWSTFSPRSFRPPLVHHNTDRYNTILGVHDDDDTPFISSLPTDNSTWSVLHRRRIRKRRYHSKQSAGWLDSFVSSMNAEEATSHSSPTKSSTSPPSGEASQSKKSKKKKRSSEMYDSYSSNKIQTVLTASASVQVPNSLTEVEYFPHFEQHPDDTSTSRHVQPPPPPPTRPDDSSRDTFAIPYSSFNKTRSRSRSSNTGKKIYSMYTPTTSQQPTHTPSSSHWEEEDWEQLYGPIPSKIIHTVGDWITDLAQEDDDDDSTSNNNSNNHTHVKKYWKNRLEEQLDHALGIHEQGKLYNRWTKNAEQKEMELVDDDSRNKGLQVFWNTHNKKRRRKELHSPYSSFWEDDGNILAVLLGKSKNTGWSSTWNSIARRKQLDFKKFTMTTVLYLSIKFFLVFLSSICRWASCRGSIPQPIVVFSLFASLLSAPKKKRWMIVGMTLIALRTCAEMIHGYMYGHDDWEEDESIGVEQDEDKGMNMRNSTGTKRG